MGKNHWQNWSGRVRCEPARIEKPDSIEAIIRTVRETGERGQRLRVVGSGHSFTELVQTDEVMVSLDEWQGIESVEKEKLVATVRGGTKLHILGELLYDQGLAMENLGDINRQSIAGAISTGTHGTGVNWPNISSQAEGLTLVNAAGEVVVCSETENRDLFKAAQVSLGSLGIISRVRLRVLPSYRLKYVRKKSTFDECAQKVRDYREANRHFEFYFFPYTETVQLKFLNETPDPADPRTVKKFLSDIVVENAAFGVMSEACRMMPGLCERVSRIAGKFVSEGEEINESHRVFSTPRMVRFNEMEYGVAMDDAIDTLREIKEWIVANRIQVHFPIEFRYVKADEIYLSPSYQRDTAYISVHMYRGMEYRKYFEGVEAIFRNHNGRPHWGKMHTLTGKQLCKLYPMWEKFHEHRRQMDPKGLFMNPYMERIFEGS